MPTRKWLKMAELYKLFGRGDFSDAAAEAMFNYESHGGDAPDDGGGGVFTGPEVNGFANGKRWLNWHVEEWRRELLDFDNRVFYIHEWYEDPRYRNHHDWLDSVLPAELVAAYHRMESRCPACNSTEQAAPENCSSDSDTTPS